MAKVTGPILSMRAAGQIGKSQVYAQWRGVPYARQYSVPSNPKSVAQVSVRTTFSWLQNLWRNAPALLQTPWFESAKGRPYTDRNRFTQVNMPLLREELDIAPIIYSPGVASGPAMADFDLTGDATELTVTLTPGSLPVGWEVVRGVAVAVLDQDPHGLGDFAVLAGEDDTTPNPAIVLPIPDDAPAPYIVGGWLEYAKPDGSYAASISQAGQYPSVG